MTTHSTILTSIAKQYVLTYCGEKHVVEEKGNGDNNEDQLPGLSA